VKAGHVHVVDADLSKYFDTIPHAELMRSVARRVCDGSLLHLVKMWLRAPVEETTASGQTTRTRAGNRGTPQGGVLSPLLANIYMRRFLKAWEQRGFDRRFGSRIVNYADDFVILCRRNAEGAMQEAQRLLMRIGLTLNETKTRVCRSPHEAFNFLGYQFGVQYRFGSGGLYIAAYPSDKSIDRLKDSLRRMTGTHMSWQSAELMVRDINRVLCGWMNYFSYGSLWKVYTRVERFLQERVRGWLVHKHRVGARGTRCYPATYLYGALGLIDPCRRLASMRKP
jgi:RNA-directed DNA polymerase